MADALSKAAFVKFREEAVNCGWALRSDPGWIPPAILRWVADPAAVEDLGLDILTDLRGRTPVLGYNC